jgi:hypothetical protein
MLKGWLKNTSAMQNVNLTDNKNPHYLLDSRVLKIFYGVADGARTQAPK